MTCQFCRSPDQRIMDREAWRKCGCDWAIFADIKGFDAAWAHWTQTKRLPEDFLAEMAEADRHHQRDISVISQPEPAVISPAPVISRKRKPKVEPEPPPAEGEPVPWFAAPGVCPSCDFRRARQAELMRAWRAKRRG